MLLRILLARSVADSIGLSYEKELIIIGKNNTYLAKRLKFCFILAP